MEEFVMSAQSNEPYALAEPALVDVAAIEQELEALWRAAAKKEDTDAVLRAAAFNLIFATSAATDEQETSELVARLATAHPSRAILLRVSDAEIKQRAWVTAYCHRPAPNSPQICSEFIRFEANARDAEAVVSTVLALRLSGLPTVLIWDAMLPAPHLLLVALGKSCERLITMLLRPCAPATELKKFSSVEDAYAGKTVVTDLSETTLAAWQRVTAELFDGHGDRARDIAEIHLCEESVAVSADMLLLGAWLSTSLEWKTEGKADAITWAFDGARKIVFHMKSTETRIEFRFRVGEPPWICKEPTLEAQVVPLLLKQLEIWGRDPLREAYLQRAREWLESTHA
jgi:glucose-6-phosphate dehydrogenase assembly protein OpcA